ncbi:MAG: hypothetical protein CVT64_10835 [Actinobacteria bacterium HGW-Actinobacteria-4]|nr:MAG: hypothetical protein CVT64_10835 [Actinobacteria bacterium HGW-Actinobacteria-4]
MASVVMALTLPILAGCAAMPSVVDDSAYDIYVVNRCENPVRATSDQSVEGPSLRDPTRHELVEPGETVLVGDFWGPKGAVRIYVSPADSRDLEDTLRLDLRMDHSVDGVDRHGSGYVFEVSGEHCPA